MSWSFSVSQRSEVVLRLKSYVTRCSPISEWKYERITSVFTLRFFVVALLAVCLFAVYFNAFRMPLIEWPANGDVDFDPRTRGKASKSVRQDWSRGIVIDAGSSGSRAYLYRWLQHSGNPEELLRIEQMKDGNGRGMVKKQEPGISSFVDDPQKAFDSLRPLLDFAATNIPESSHRDTQLFVLATAGLRLLPQEKQDRLLQTLRLNIRSNYVFHLPDTHVEVLSGRMEGIYGWIAVNYVLGRFDHSRTTFSSSSPVPQQSTVGALDLGGASAQITFEVDDKTSILPSNTAIINLGCDSHSTIHSHRLYVTTLLSYGSNEALSRYHNFLLDTRHTSTNASLSIVTDPCLPLNRREVVTVKERNVQLSLIGIGNFTDCRRMLRNVIDKALPCGKVPCVSDGVASQPPVGQQSDFFGVGEYWFTTDMAGLSGLYDARKFERVAMAYCHTRWSQLERHFKSKLYPKHAGWDRLRLQCFKSAWLSIMLHDVYHFPRNSSFHLTTTEQINHHTIQWTLGAILFKTRYLPLREVQRHNLQKSQHNDRADGHKFSFLIFIVICVALFVFYLYWTKRKSVGRIVSPQPRFFAKGRVFKFSESLDENV